ncbi:MAG: hypothetical protein VB013_15100 [Anaerolineaceae bacterium]|nr:hypothetical protein [Anaerolineaceae bacterium]
MSFTYTYIQEGQYLLFVHQGELNDATVLDFLDKGIKIAIDHHSFKMVNDYRKVVLNISASKVIEAQKFISEKFLIGGVDPRKITRALVVDESSGNTMYYRIFETINLNHGLMVKLFFDMDEAVQWIKAQ